MKVRLILLTFYAALTAAAAFAAETVQDQLNGTWSGSWITDGGVRDAMTIELRYEDNGKLTGRFVSPISMNFTRAAFNSKTKVLSVEASDAASGKQYKLDGKVEGTEIKGTATADNRGGQAHLIKWTYVPGTIR
jgi:hypothetical protein